MLLSAVIFLLAEGEGHAPWWDYPGLEFWKFVNLFLFAGGMIYLLKRPLSNALQVRRKTNKEQLVIAQRERDEAQAKLAEVNERLSRLDAEVAAIKENSKVEAESERARIVRETQEDIGKVREQAQREIAGAAKVAKHSLRRYAAEQSVQLAEELIRRDIRSDDDARLIKLNVDQLGGM